jgi:hypothetical protein
MLIAAAVCPHPPLLIPEATGAGGAERTAEFPPHTPGRLHHFGIPFTVGRIGPDARQLPLSLTIGKWLLSQHAARKAAWWGIASDALPAECLQLGEKLAALELGYRGAPFEVSYVVASWRREP